MWEISTISDLIYFVCAWIKCSLRILLPCHICVLCNFLCPSIASFSLYLQCNVYNPSFFLILTYVHVSVYVHALMLAPKSSLSLLTQFLCKKGFRITILNLQHFSHQLRLFYSTIIFDLFIYYYCCHYFLI